MSLYLGSCGESSSRNRYTSRIAGRQLSWEELSDFRSQRASVHVDRASVYERSHLIGAFSILILWVSITCNPVQ